MRIRNTSRLAATLRIGLWNLVLFLVGVLVVELVFGNWFGNDDLKHLNILRNRSWQYTVNYPGVRADEKQVIYSRDRWGLRGNYGRPEDIDILTVGGSTTDQRFITDGCTWQDVLSENLKLDGREIRIANAGINGRTTFGHQYDLDLWFPGIKGLAPDYILLYLGINDMFFDQPNSRFDAAFLKAPTIKERIKRNSAVYYIYRTILGVHLAKERDLAYTSVDYENAEWTNIPRLSNYRERLVSRLDGYEKRLHHLLVKIKRLGATPIIVTQPRGDYRIIDGTVVGLASAQPRLGTQVKDSALGVLDQNTANGVDYYNILSLFNQASMNLCKQADGICIDLANELRFENGDFYDHAHNTKRGAKKIGNYLQRKLKILLPTDVKVGL